MIFQSCRHRKRFSTLAATERFLPCVCTQVSLQFGRREEDLITEFTVVSSNTFVIIPDVNSSSVLGVKYVITYITWELFEHGGVFSNPIRHLFLVVTVHMPSQAGHFLELRATDTAGVVRRGWSEVLVDFHVTFQMP